MIEALRSYNNHTLVGLMVNGIPASLNAISTLVHRIALNVLVHVIFSIPLFYVHHNLFVLGFIIGFIFDKQVCQIVEKVNIVYAAHRTRLEGLLLFGGGGILAVLTMPTSTIIATLYYSAQWGAQLYQSSLMRMRQFQPQEPQPLPQQAGHEQPKPDMGGLPPINVNEVIVD